ncbi:nucleotidyltransferase family protein [Candidatus Margulisiibacteriota bacterium]
MIFSKLNNRNKHGLWPTPEQELLLDACLLEGESGFNAWKKWHKLVDVEKLDTGSFRLLPLLYHNLQGLLPEGPLLSKYKSVYQYTWYKNHIVFHKTAKLIEVFNKKAIKTMVLKGIALIENYYKDFGIRPMNDIDLLVPLDKAPESINLLKELGWKLEKPISSNLDNLFFSINRAITLKDKDGFLLDLHFFTQTECKCPGDDDILWEKAIPLNINNVRTNSLNSTLLLLQVLLRGILLDTVTNLRWITDAYMILNNKEKQIDWDLFLETATRRYAVIPLKKALSYHKKRYKTAIPDIVIPALNSKKVLLLDKIGYKVRTTRTELLGDLPKMMMNYFYLSRSSEGVSKISFFKYLKVYWELDTLRKLPKLVLAKIRHRFVKYIFNIMNVIIYFIFRI